MIRISRLKMTVLYAVINATCKFDCCSSPSEEKNINQPDKF